MRDSWPKVTLGDVADINPENTDQLRDNDEITYIDLSSVSSAAGISADLFHGSYRIAPGRARRIVRKDDVLISTVRPYLKGFSMVPQYLDGAVASTGFCVLRAKRKQILPGLIWAVVGTDQFVENLMSKATGSSYPAVRPSDVAAHPIALPPLAEQTRIVDVMSSVDAYIAALQQQAEDARAARNAVLHELLTAGGENWTETTLGKVAEIQQGQNLAIATLTTGDYPVYGANGIVGHFDRWNSDQEVVALGCRGSCGTVHFVTGKAWLANNVMAIWPKDVSQIVVSFIALVLETADLRSSGVISGQVQPQITRTSLSPLVIAVPSLSDQEEIVGIVSAMDDVIRSTEQAISEAQELRSGLLSDLLSGDQEIPETYDRLLGTA